MKWLVPDASVAIKWFVPEHDSDQALLILDEYDSGLYRFVAPELLVSEIGNILWKKRDLVDKESGTAIIRNLLEWDIALVPSTRIITAAYRLAWRYERTVYDSMYLATAQLYRCDMVTADERLTTPSESGCPLSNCSGIGHSVRNTG